MRIHRPVHDDAFNFTIELIDSNGKSIEAIAGAENIFAARAAFDVLVNTYNERTRLRLRQGGRVLRILEGRGS